MSDEIIPGDESHVPEAFEPSDQAETDNGSPTPVDALPAEARATDDAVPVPERPALPVKRSWGRVLRIDEDGAAWLADFRPFGREVLVRLKNAYQANPGHVLEYELKASGPGRWSGVDVTFNRPPDLAGVLALDEGRGLSAEGLDFVKRAIVADPAVLRLVFSPSVPRVGQQLLEDSSFPLPRALVTAALRHPALAAAAAKRLQGGALRSPEEYIALLLVARSRDEDALLRRLVEEHADWLLEPLPLPVDGRRERVIQWWKRTGELRWLLQLEGAELPAEAALALLRRGVFGNLELATAESAAWERRLDAATRRRLLTAAFRDPARRGDSAVFAGLGGEFRDVLTELAMDQILGSEARALLLERAELSPAAALDLLRKGAQGEARERLVALLAAAPAVERPELDPALALELFQQGVSKPGESGLAEWLGCHAAVQEQVAVWMENPATRDLGLRALCHGKEFSRARVQRLLGMDISQELREQLVKAISRVSPERWSERYLLNPAEKAAWQGAGAPLV